MPSGAGERSAAKTRLARLRIERNLSQRELAQRAGLSPATYQRLERGEMRSPPLGYLVNCALVLRVELDQVIEEVWRTWWPTRRRPRQPPD
jgi:transcriptional regulator with XRE-family HTH domain